MRLLTELQFCPTSSEKSTCDRKCFFQFYSPPGEWYCYAVVFGLRRVIFAVRVWAANRISLQPQGAISLLRKQKYHADEVSISLKCICTSCNSVLRAQNIQVFRLGYFHLCRRHNIIWPKVNIISSAARTSFLIFSAQMNEVAFRANEVATSRKRCDASHQWCCAPRKWRVAVLN